MLTKTLSLRRLLLILLAVTSYFLGVSLARYLGVSFAGFPFALGAGWIALIAVLGELLDDYFRYASLPLAEGETFHAREVTRRTMLQISLGALSVAAALAMALLLNGFDSPLALGLLTAGLLLALTYALPPVRLVERGFGEFALAFLLGAFSPALGYFLQANQPIPALLQLLVLPLTLLILAAFLVENFATYASDLRLTRATMLIKTGWERGVSLHHALIVLAYAAFALALVLGAAWTVFSAGMFSVVVAGVQIFLVQKLSEGAPPNWRLLRFIAYATPALTLYFLIFNLWIN
jgi:1,4-dihydroxy-2-naphthoate octaprenyltransferase